MENKDENKHVNNYVAVDISRFMYYLFELKKALDANKIDSAKSKINEIYLKMNRVTDSIAIYDKSTSKKLIKFWYNTAIKNEKNLDKNTKEVWEKTYEDNKNEINFSFSCISNGQGNVLFFKKEDIQKLDENNPENYIICSHTSIAHYFGIKGKEEDNWNKWRYNSHTKKLTTDKLNTIDDSKIVEKIIKKYLSENEIMSVLLSTLRMPRRIKY